MPSCRVGRVIPAWRSAIIPRAPLLPGGVGFWSGQAVISLPPGMARTLRVTVVPCYMLVGPGGRVEWVHRGRLSDSDLARLHSRVRWAGSADPGTVGADHVSPSRPH